MCAELGYNRSISVPHVGLSDGVPVLWNSNVFLSVISQSSNLVDCHVESNGISFYLSFVYGYPEPSNRHILWERLERLSTTRHDAWLIMGDFNEIKGNDEKRGGPLRPESSFLDFRKMITICDFHDLKSFGDRFSWKGKRYSHDIWCCLDRSMANSQWLALFPLAQTEFLPFEGSDHRPLVTNITGLISRRYGTFRYDKRLFSREDFKERVRVSWHSESDTTPLNRRISQCRYSMATWKRRNRTNSAEQIEVLKRRLDYALSNTGFTTQDIHCIRQELSKAYHDEDTFWRLKSRNNWRNFGDRNTKYFYAATKSRLARNIILSIEDDAGTFHHGDLDIGKIVEVYFKNMFTSTREDHINYQSVLRAFSQELVLK